MRSTRRRTFFGRRISPATAARENDAEHAWHMAVMAYLLQEYSNEPVDVARVMLMCLLHDVVEIDAGDTYAYDADGLKTQKAREDAAKQRHLFAPAGRPETRADGCF